MGALPKRRISRSRQGKRRSAISLKQPTLIPCPNCGELKRPHQVCPSCGYYGGKQVVLKRQKKQHEDSARPKA